MMEKGFSAALADAGPDPGIFTYFADSNLAGQLIVIVLGVLSMWAWTIIITKISELKKLHWANEAHVGKFRALPNVIDHPDDFFKGPAVPC